MTRIVTTRPGTKPHRTRGHALLILVWQGLRALAVLVALLASSGLWLVTAGIWQHWRARKACYRAMVAKGVPSGLARRLAKELPGLKTVLRPFWSRLKHEKRS